MQVKALVAVAAAASLLLSACSSPGDSQAAAPQGPPPVTVATPITGEVVDWDEFVGRFEAVQNVEVRPRASGYLVGVHFTDGQYVRQGQLLFTVDARPAQAALAQAQAQLARAQAQLANARTELARSRTLAEQQAASTEEVEQRTAALRAAQADVAAAQAAVRAQQLNVGFTRIVAPISGRISERRVDPGNAVTADQTVLTSIVSTDPIHFVFDGAESLLLRYQRENSGVGTGSTVRVRLQDETDYVHGGTLDFIDASVGQTTGTVRARALIRNPNGLLRPGMFGNARLAASRPYQALMVPETAIVTDAARRVLYVVDGEGNVTARPVQLGPLMGSLRVIRGGVGPQDRIIIDGLQRTRPGQQVQAQMGRIEATPPPPEQAAEAAPPPSSATPAASR